MWTSLFSAFLTSLVLHMLGLAVLSLGWHAWRLSFALPQPDPAALIAVVPVPNQHCRPSRTPSPSPRLSLSPFPVRTQRQNPCRRRRLCQHRWWPHSLLILLLRSVLRPDRHLCPPPAYASHELPHPRRRGARRRGHHRVCPMSLSAVPAVPLPGQQPWFQNHLSALAGEQTQGSCQPTATCRLHRAPAVVAPGARTGTVLGQAARVPGLVAVPETVLVGGRGGAGTGGAVSARPIGGYQVQPRYPESARRQGVEGTVLLKMRITEQGRVEDVQVERTAGHPELDQSAMGTPYGAGALNPPAAAVRQWRVGVQLPVEFKLQ